VTHYVIAWLKQISPSFGRVVDGTPLLLMEKGKWHTETMLRVRIQIDDALTWRGIKD
jgi:uncharacterized membrane protein YcaP (DUF421 family)